MDRTAFRSEFANCLRIQSHIGTGLLFCVILMTGCSADGYKAAADRQGYGILKDRKQTTLGYQPEAVAKTTVPADPPRKAFNKIPMTPIPPPTIPPMEPLRVMLPFGRLSPAPFEPVAPPIERKATTS